MIGPTEGNRNTLGNNVTLACHTPDDSLEVALTILRVLSGCAFEDALYVAETETLGAHVECDATFRVVMVSTPLHRYRPFRWWY